MLLRRRWYTLHIEVHDAQVPGLRAVRERSLANNAERAGGAAGDAAHPPDEELLAAATAEQVSIAVPPQGLDAGRVLLEHRDTPKAQGPAAFAGLRLLPLPYPDRRVLSARRHVPARGRGARSLDLAAVAAGLQGPLRRARLREHVHARRLGEDEAEAFTFTITITIVVAVVPVVELAVAAQGCIRKAPVPTPALDARHLPPARLVPDYQVLAPEPADHEVVSVSSPVDAEPGPLDHGPGAQRDFV